MSWMNRRDMLLGATAAAGLSALPARAAAPAARNGSGKRPTLCYFSKPLPFMDYPTLGKTLHEMGFAGVDLTVRPQGHVLPENVAADLPKAHKALKDHGVEISMITTGLTTAEDPAARPTLQTAAKLGVPFYKLGYYRMSEAELVDLDRLLGRVKAQVEGLAAVGGHAGIQGGFHNHSGRYIGSAMWDHWYILRDIEPGWIGFYFDPCHATIEGGDAGWKIGFHRLASRLNMVAIKDFYWEKRDGKWDRIMCPLGEGMVDFPAFFKMLAASGFSGPISLHVEYEFEAHSEAAKREKILQASEKDFDYLKGQVDAAFG